MAEKKSFLQEFKEFASKGNVVDLSVGVIVGGAFGTITKSMTDDIIMPVVSLFLGGINFSDWKLVLRQARVAADGTEIAAVSVNYGTFISTVINFIILAFVVFCLVKALNAMRAATERKEKAAAEAAAAAKAKADAEAAEIAKLAAAEKAAQLKEHVATLNSEQLLAEILLELKSK